MEGIDLAAKDSSNTPPSPPFVEVAGIFNFRDLGGYAVSNGKSIRQNSIFRCGEPNRVTPAGIQTLRGLGITHIYDLRSETELHASRLKGHEGVVEWNGCERVFVPVFRDWAYDPESLALRYKDYATGGPEGFTRAYADIMKAAPTAYRTILLHIANDPTKPLILHCTAGKDRTGVLCALVLSLCGVDDETVAYEYSLTELGLAPLRDMIVARLMENPALKGNAEGAINMISARAKNMMATLAMIKENYGGAEGYMIKECGLTQEEVEKIRKNLVVEIPPIHSIPS